MRHPELVHDRQIPAWPQLDFVVRHLLLHAHAHALVQPRGAGLVPGINRQTDARNVPLLQRSKRMQQKRLAEPSTTVGLAYTECGNPAHLGIEIIAFL